MPQQYLNDNGNWRQLREVYVNDNGNWRSIVQVYVNDNGNWRTVFQRYDESTMVAGTNTVYFGYEEGGLGSLTPSTLGDGIIVQRIISDPTGPLFSVVFRGFSSDPGIGYLVKIEINGISLSSTAASYSYSSGVAQWDWFANASLANGGTYTVLIYRA